MIGKMGHSRPNLGEGVSGGECGVADERRIHWSDSMVLEE